MVCLQFAEKNFFLLQNWQLECVVVACSSGRMEYIGWLLGSSRAPVSDQLRKDAPNGLVLHGDLRDVSNTAARSTSVETNVYEHVADTCNTFVADLPFLVNGLVDVSCFFFFFFSPFFCILRCSRYV
jgi:hypothetical protein